MHLDWPECEVDFSDLDPDLIIGEVDVDLAFLGCAVECCSGWVAGPSAAPGRPEFGLAWLYFSMAYLDAIFGNMAHSFWVRLPVLSAFLWQ